MIRDLFRAARWLRNNPLFTVCAVLILAFGIGATTAVFSIVDAVLLRPLPWASADRLVRISETGAKRPAAGVPATDYLRWRERTDLFDHTAAYLKDTVTLTGSGQPDQVAALRAEGALFSILGAQAQLGRTFLDNGDVHIAVISDRLWRKRFQADPAVIGRTMTVSDELFTIAGVMPREFGFAYADIDVWMPFSVSPAVRNYIEVLARLQPNVTTEQAGAAMEIVARQMEREKPAQNAGLRIAVAKWTERPDSKYELTLVLVLVAVALVLLIACADVGSLLLSRAVQRQREIAIRTSLGAGVWRVVRQLLAESLVLAVAGSAGGILVAYYATGFLAARLALLPIVLPGLQRAAIDGRVLLFSTGLCAILVVLCSLAPVVLAFRTDVQTVLRGVRTGSGPKGSSRMFSILIASEAAFACLLLVGSGLMLRSLVRLQQQDHGFRPDHVLTLRVPVGVRTAMRPAGKYDTRPRQIAYYNEILQRVERIPGITAAAVVNNLPLSGVSTSLSIRDREGRGLQNSTRTVSPAYFQAMGIPLVAGRTFTDADHADAPGVAILNQSMVRQLFPDGNAVGQPLPSEEKNAPPVTVVGVVKDSSQASWDQPTKGEIYRPVRQFIFAAFMSTIVVRTPGDPLSIASAVQKEVWAVDPDQPVIKVETMNDVVARSIWRPRVSAWIFSALGALALLLTAAGVYGVVAYTTSLRTRELGIRVALGATPTNVIAAVWRGAMLPIAIGLCVGLAAAGLLSELLASLLYGVRATDLVSYAGAGAVLLAIGSAAILRPAWKAAAGNPVDALRME